MIRYFALALTAAVLFSCAPKTTVILLPEEDGKTGAVIVKNKASETVLDQPYTSTTLTGDRSALKIKPISKETVETDFQELVKAEPPKPAQFILYFQHDAVILTQDSMALIPKVLETVKKREPAQVSVIGHTDTRGRADHNVQLSLERAEYVADLLKKSGMELIGLSVTSHGENDLLVQTEDNVSEPRNRRVEIMIR